MPLSLRARLLLLLVCSMPAAIAGAQGVGINATGAAADTSAILDLTSTSKGLLPPRMTAAQRSAIVLPATGLVVYQTDGSAGLYYNLGSPAAPSWKLVADAGSLSSGPWTVNGSNIHYSAGNVGIQRSSPSARLDVLGGNWDVVNGEGDFRIGDNTARLKIGVATGGGGLGGVGIMQQGQPGGYNVLTLGAQGNKVLHVNGNTQRVGIGIDGPNAPLGFPATLGKKITLYPGATGDAGFGMSSNRLQIFADNPNADVALGYDQAGTFTERFAVKPSGALALSGSTGGAGQVLQSNGGAAATWVAPTRSLYDNTFSVESSGDIVLPAYSGYVNLPGMSQTFTLTGNARVIIHFSVSTADERCDFCGGSLAEVAVAIDSGRVHLYRSDLPNGGYEAISATLVRTLGAGQHTVQLQGYAYVKGIRFGSTNPNFNNTMTVQVIPQ